MKFIALALGTAAVVSACGGSGGDPKVCTPTVTATWYGGKDAGCPYDCPIEGASDEGLVLPCGCTSAADIVVKTKTICATASPCGNLLSAWGTFVQTATNCPTTTATAAPKM